MSDLVDIPAIRMRCRNALISMAPEALKPLAEMYLPDALANLPEAELIQLDINLQGIINLPDDAARAQALLKIGGDMGANADQASAFLALVGGAR